MCVRKEKSKELTEAGATRLLKWLFYSGCGNRYLGWRLFEYELLPDNTEKLVVVGGARTWPTPTGEKRRYWNPVFEHLKGYPRGVCRGRGETSLPFVSVDLDRHDGSIPAKAHIAAVLAAGRILKNRFGFLRWLVEVNPENGSCKFFGFTGKPIPAERAWEISKTIHTELTEAGLGNREVFPHNSPQVFLPFREGKSTIIDSGVLGQCIRRRKRNDYFESFATYSVLAFVRWLRNGGNYDEQTLLKTLGEACRNVPDTAGEIVAVPPMAQPPLPTSSPAEDKIPVKVVSSGVDLQQEPDSFIRQRVALLALCRRNHRVVLVEEALDHIRENKLYTGDWEMNRAARRVRARQILSFISQSFDPALCQGVTDDIKVGDNDAWRRGSAPMAGEHLLVMTWTNMGKSDRGTIAMSPIGNSWRPSCRLLSFCCSRIRTPTTPFPKPGPRRFGICWRNGALLMLPSVLGNGPLLGTNWRSGR